jgi:hypothetical protein
MKNYRLISYSYLLLVPIVAAAFGFGVGHVSSFIYLPLWGLNVLAMLYASWSLGLKTANQKTKHDYHLAIASFFLIVPYIFISMFAGLGPPPETAIEWTNTSTEQQVRYFFLVISGIFIAFGFIGISDRLKAEGENVLARISSTAIIIALPLFIINMLYWGFYLTELFKNLADQKLTDYPEWFLPMRQLFGVISAIEVALTYFATFTIVIALRKAGWVEGVSGFFYMFFSSVAFVVIILSVFLTETFRIPGFAVSIPAFPFLMPYYLGVNILYKIGGKE